MGFGVIVISGANRLYLTTCAGSIGRVNFIYESPIMKEKKDGEG